MNAPARIESGIDLDQESFDVLRTLLREIAGITLSDRKSDLVRTRLRSRLDELEIGSFAAYAARLGKLSVEDSEWQILVNALTTNKTDFFREKSHFDLLTTTILPSWQDSGRRSFTIWSAACSTGEEPYTIAMLVRRFLETYDIAIKITASDIDTNVLAHAANGVYARPRLIDVPSDYQREAFTPGTGSIANWVRIRNEIRELVEFRQCNLSRPPYPWNAPFDLIFCRNVLIYFSQDMIRTVVEGLYDAARDGALLFIGHSESLQSIKTRWQYVKPSIYRKCNAR